ncbi:MAG TPA: phenylalanine--tRNA ligase subunit alpha [Acidimicrobiales bacterium]|nr:phenylalanine--tRNA ligase subunit alpha [Acidimicrobiales bacterium]
MTASGEGESGAGEGELDVEALVAAAAATVGAATTTTELDEARTELVGKRSALTRARQRLGALDPADRPAAGQRLNEARRRIEELLEARRDQLEGAERLARLEAERLDLTELVAPPTRGRLHLVQRTRDELEDVFVGMGFAVAEGPEAETDWYNFEALHMPPAHPARGMWDTLYLELGEPETVLLRTHTSPVQIRLLQRQGPPVYAVMPGTCYRRDTPDARHIPTFHQIEGLVVDRGISFADLAGTIETFTTAYFGPDIHARLRPSYFPFTEPSAEFEITCTICKGAGCRTCSHTGWIELGGCGMVDPAVLAAVGVDAETWTGFAFGFGIDRCAQMRHEIPDMRVLLENDVRILRQV